MKKMICLLLVFCLLCGPALADGDPNIEGGGGDTGTGSGSSAWNAGDDGVRVTILQGTVPISILDYSNTQRSRTQRSFKKQCKLYYKNGGQLTPRSDQYTNIVPTIPLPWIIGSDGSSNIDAIKLYFITTNTIRDLANDAGILYEELTNGEYKLMLEPISYFKYDNIQYAMTATEAALFDVKVGGDLSYWMGTLTHQNQPLSMFLERPDVGIDPWTKATSGRQSNINILNYLGVGIVSFKPEEPMEPPPDLGDYVYRTNTDVITAAYVKNNGRNDVTPRDEVYITFEILDRSYSTQYVCPAESGQLVWIKWHTPSTPQTIDIEVSDGTKIRAVIEEVPDIEPPDPDFYDVKPNGFRLEDTPDWGAVTTATWSEWIPEWHPPAYIGFVHVPGYWTFDKGNYTVELTASCNLTPDSRVKTAVRMGADQYEMKSGYGVNTTCSVSVMGGGGVADADVTPVQNVLALFPEFGYQQYNRLLQTAHPNYYRGDWQFKPNRYSYYSNPTHFTPLWYPDRTDYEVPLAVFDAWTPAGMLYTSVSDSVQIDGSAFDDWYIRVLEN